MTTRPQRLVAAFAALLVAAAVGGATAARPTAPAPAPADLFTTSHQCLACHQGMTAPDGEDASIGSRWRSTIMAHASKDPYWHASVRRETLEHPGAAAAIEDKCSTCHMPMARFTAQRQGGQGQVLAHLAGGRIDLATPAGVLAEDGVSCAVCHQVAPDNLGRAESFDGGFLVDTARVTGDRGAFGPFDVPAGTQRVMASSSGFAPRRAEHIRSAEHCATCHTLYTHALDADGREVAELPEQVPFLEWKHSSYPGVRTCQDCHMRPVPGAAPIASVLGPPREGARQHLFRGGNFLFLRLLAAHARPLGVTALAGELEENARATVDYLQSAAARVTIEEATAGDGASLAVPVRVENLAGHKLPSAYPSRRVWLRVTVTDHDGATLFASGELRDDGAIEGNDNDADAARFEPHYDEITAPDQVQVYEAILGDPAGRVTTGLLSAASYLKDNRVLPRGFDKATAPHDVAVAGGASADESFTGGGDRVVYRVPLRGTAGPVTVTAELWYQPIAYRWAMNLAAVDAPEPRRFVAMYGAMPGRQTAVRLAAATRTVEAARAGS